MAYDGTRPRDNDLVKLSAQYIRDNFEGLRTEGIVIPRAPLYGVGAPAAALGDTGEKYIDAATGNQYIKVADNEWKMILQMSSLYQSTENVQSVIFGNGVSAPDSLIGKDGDMYINYSIALLSGIGYQGLYHKSDGVWQRMIDLTRTTMVSTVGMIGYFATQVTPPGWLPFTGAEVSRTAYYKLFDLIGTAFGDGDGSTTFTLPDGRGRFLRALDLNCGLDLGREFGSFQDCAIENITGSVDGFFKTGGGVSGALYYSVSLNTQPTGASSQGYNTLNIDTSRAVRTSTETRPINIAFPLYICYM